MVDYDITSRALLVSLKISTWTGRKYDKAASRELHSTHAATPEAGRYSKHLLADAKAHRLVLSRAAEARNAHYTHTLPWTDEGWRLLPTANYQTYTEKIRQHRQRFESALADFLANYETLREEARVKLGTLYRETDYPDVTNVATKFGWDIDFRPVPSTGDIRVNLSEDEIVRIEAQVAERVQIATRQAVEDAWRRLHQTVNHIRERLSNPDAIFRDSLIDNTRDLCDVLSRLNVTQDEALEAVRVQVLQDLASVEPDDLRKNQRRRAEVAAKADAILSAITGSYVPLPEGEAEASLSPVTAR